MAMSDRLLVLLVAGFVYFFCNHVCVFLFAAWCAELMFERHNREIAEVRETAARAKKELIAYIFLRSQPLRAELKALKSGADYFDEVLRVLGDCSSSAALDISKNVYRLRECVATRDEKAEAEVFACMDLRMTMMFPSGQRVYAPGGLAALKESVAKAAEAWNQKISRLVSETVTPNLELVRELLGPELEEYCPNPALLVAARIERV
jgi:hypothetical protein